MPRYASSHILWLGNTIHACVLFYVVWLCVCACVVSSPLNSVLCCEHLRYMYFLASIYSWANARKAVVFADTHTNTSWINSRRTEENKGIIIGGKWAIDLSARSHYILITNTWKIFHTRIDRALLSLSSLFFNSLTTSTLVLSERQLIVAQRCWAYFDLQCLKSLSNSNDKNNNKARIRFEFLMIMFNKSVRQQCWILIIMIIIIIVKNECKRRTTSSKNNHSLLLC